MYTDIENTACKLMKEYGDGNISAIQSALKGIDPNLIKYSLERFTEQGKMEFKEKKYLDAINSFSQAISGYKLQLEKNNEQDNKKELAKLFSNRSQCYLKLNSDEDCIKALEDAKESILLNPEWSKGWYRAGKALYFLKLYEKAIILFKAAQKRESNLNINEGSKQCLDEIEKLIKICEKKADHEIALKRVTVDYSKFEDALREIEMEEIKEASKNLELNDTNPNIINLPNNFANSLIGSSTDENLQLELSPDLSQEEINNLKLSLGGSSVEIGNKKKKKSSKISFDVKSKFFDTSNVNIENDSIKGISRLVQMSTEIQWFKRIIENFVDNSYLYINFWIKCINNEINKINLDKSKEILFIGSSSFILPIYLYKNSEQINITVVTQTRSNFSCIYRVYSNIALSNNVKLLHLNSSNADFLKEIESNYTKETNIDNNFKNEKSIKLIHGHIQKVNENIWNKVTPSSIFIDPSIFEPGLLGYGLVSNIWSLYSISKEEKSNISITPSLIEVYVQFSNIKIPSINLEIETENKDNNSSEIKFDKLNEALWSPYWEPLKVKQAYKHIEFISQPILLGTLPIEKMLNERTFEYFILNCESNEYYEVKDTELINNNNKKIYKGVINYFLQSKTSINSIILTFKASKEIINDLEVEKIILLNTCSQLNDIKNDSVIPPAIQWLGTIITNNDNSSQCINFNFQIENTRIVINPAIKDVESKSLNEKIDTNLNLNKKIPQKFTCSLPRSVIENLWDIKSLEIWSKALINAYKSSTSQNINKKIFEGIITSTSPGAILPMTLLYISSKLNKSTKDNLFNIWKKFDIHFTCVENLPNIQELYMKIIKDNIDVLLSDVIENDVRSLYNHSVKLNDPKINQTKYWKPIIETEENLAIKNNENENILFKKWLSTNTSAKHILNKKLNERLTFINTDVRQIIPQTSTANLNQNLEYYFISEKARIFTGMNFDHDGLGEGIIPLWATAFQNEIVRKYNNKIQNNPIPFRISFYGFIAQIGNNDEFGVNISFWDTYRFEGNMQWIPITNSNKIIINQRTDIFHILTLELNYEGLSKLSELKNEILAQITNEGRINSIVIFFDLWIDEFNVLTTSPFNHEIERPNFEFLNTSDLLNNQEQNMKKQINIHNTNLWKPIFHMIPQQSTFNQDSIQIEFSVDNNLTRLKFSIKSFNNNGENTPSTITSDEIENSPFVLPPLGDIEYIQLRQKYNSIIKEISPSLYSENDSIINEAFNASLNIALNPSYYLGKNTILNEDIAYDIDSLNWLCQSFLL